MRKLLVALALSAGLLLSGLPSIAEAGKGSRSSSSRSSSSSGRSYSSSSRSSPPSGKSYSSGSRSLPSRPSAPPATSPRGKSYSSSPATNLRKPAAPPPSPRSDRYSAGSPATSSRPSSAPPASTNPQKPGGSSFDAGAAAAQRQAASRESFRGRSTAASSPASKPPAGMPSTNGKPSTRPASPGSISGKNYASGGPTATTTDQKPAAGSFDTSAAAAQRRQESKAAFTRGQQPRSTWTDSENRTHPIDRRDRQIDSLRRQLDHERWVNREARQRQFYGDYYGRPAFGPVVVYHDPYSSFFWGWLLAQSLDHRASWAYHHRDYMDQARYRDLLAHDAQLEARIRQLEAQQVPRDPSYLPEGMNEPDLMYRDEYVTAVYNPQPRPTHVLGVLLKTFVVIGIMALVVWLLFFKRWGGSAR